MSDQKNNDAEVKEVEITGDDDTLNADEEIKDREDSQKQPVEELSEEDILKNKVAELEDKLLRNAAEFENYKKRTIRQYEDMVAFANEKTISEMLEIIDSFDRALDQKDEIADSNAFIKGIELINNQMHNLLVKYNVKPIEAMGKPFDPNFHEAMMQVESDEFPEGTVAFEMSKGYMIGDRVLRHSKVGVAKGSQSKEESKEEDKNE